MTPSKRRVTVSFKARKRITGKPVLMFDECNTLKKVLKKYINGINATDVLPRKTADNKVHQKAEELGLCVITSDKGFVIDVISQGKSIVFQNSKNERYFIESTLVQTDCDNFKYHCPVTFFVQEFDEVILP